MDKTLGGFRWATAPVLADLSSGRDREAVHNQTAASSDGASTANSTGPRNSSNTTDVRLVPVGRLAAALHKAFVKYLCLNKGDGRRRLMMEFPGNG